VEEPRVRSSCLDKADGQPVPARCPVRLTLAAMLAALLMPAASAQDASGVGTATREVARHPQHAQGDQAVDPEGESTKTDPRTRTARRLLHAVHGGVLRAVSRWNGDRWEHQHDGRWEALPVGAIESARLESEVLTESRKRRSAVRRDDATGLAAHANWLLEEGLYTEGLNLVSEVLELSPDQPEALALLRSGTLAVALPTIPVAADQRPAARARLLDFAAAAPRSLQEMAIEDLREAVTDPEEVAVLRAELAARLTDPSATARAFAALALRRLVPSEAVSQAEVEEFLRRALQDVSPEVRGQASLALRDVREEGLILPVVKALESQSPALRRHAAESLGQMGYSAAVPALVTRLLTLPLNGSSGGYHAPSANIFVGRQIAYVAGFNVNVAQNAAIGDPEIGTLQEGATVGVSVLGAADVATEGYLAESKALRTALTSLTGADPGASKKAWKGWWAKNEARWAGGAATTGAGSDPATPSSPDKGVAPR